MTKILLISDTHMGITKQKKLTDVFQKMSETECDVVIHAGDYCGGTRGYKSVRWTVKEMRKFFPDKPIISTIGNHDFWSSRSPKLIEFVSNLNKIKNIFQENNIHFIDENTFTLNNIVFFGASGWYQTPNPETNDINFLPKYIESDNIHQFLFKRSNDIVFDQLNKVKELIANNPSLKPVFISHFPVINTGDDYKGAFERFSWSKRIGEILQEDVGCRHFINGHAHQLHQGPLRYESGSDYFDPKFITIEID